ncbi:MAG: Hpt domain-containing protein [Rubrivivax sp.]
MTPRPAPEPLQLDAQALAKLRELDPEGRHGVVQRVLQTFETTLQRQAAELREARDRGDMPVMGRIAHTIKPSSAAVGALALSALCADVERQVRNGETAGLLPRVENLLSEAERALVAVRAMLRT